MKIIQVTPSLGYGDAVGNNVIAIDRLLKRNGYDCVVYSGQFDKRIPDDIKKRDIKDWRKPAREDVLIYHMASGWDHIEIVKNAECRKMAIYHNVTPPHFFKRYDPQSCKMCSEGLSEVKSLKDIFDFVVADSNFNKGDLLSYGYTRNITAIPILINFKDYENEPNWELVNKYKDTEGTKILFVGRIVPNKKYEDLIRAFCYYKKIYDPKAKLFLVGKYNENDLYYQRLVRYIEELKAEDVYFSGHIGFKDILAYYRLADIFLCLSEHEGFCVPLVEAMYFDLPIVAYDSCAVGEILGDGGVLINDKDSLYVASVINEIMKNPETVKQLKDAGRERLKRYDNAIIEEELLAELKKYFDGELHV